MLIENITDEMSIDKDGSYILAGKTYNEEVFKDFTVNPLPGNIISIVNTEFNKCKVSIGTCMLMKGTVLKEVTFNDFNCGDALHISSEAILDKVKIIGPKFPKMIWIRPESQGDQRDDHNKVSVEWMLDISNFNGEVSITGLPVNKVKIDTEKQVIVGAEIFKKLDWKRLGLSSLSYWRLLAKKVEVDSSSEGIFSIPKKTDRDYERSINELKILRGLGHIK